MQCNPQKDQVSIVFHTYSVYVTQERQCIRGSQWLTQFISENVIRELSDSAASRYRCV